MAGPPLPPEVEWFFVEDGRQVGPLSKPELRKRFESRELDPQTLVWSASLPNWVSAQEIPGLVPEMPPPLPLSPPPPLPLSSPPLAPDEKEPIPEVGENLESPGRSARGNHLAAVLILTGDLEKEYRLKKVGELVIGRSHQCDVMVEDKTVSSRHAIIRFRGGAFMLTDLQSSNGTFVNGQRISLPAQLDDGDVLYFGKSRFRFSLDSVDEGREGVVDRPVAPAVDSETQLCSRCGEVFGAEFRFCVHCGKEAHPSSG